MLDGVNLKSVQPFVFFERPNSLSVGRLQPVGTGQSADARHTFWYFCIQVELTFRVEILHQSVEFFLVIIDRFGIDQLVYVIPRSVHEMKRFLARVRSA